MKTDLFFSSNQKRLQKYQADRRLEEVNGNLQQAKVYAKIQSDLGDEEEANHYLKLATNIINKFGEKTLNLPTNINASQPTTLVNIIKSGIQNGNLSNIFNQMKKIKSNNKETQIVISDLNNSTELKTAVNDTLLSSASPEEKAKTVENLITGGNSKTAEEINSKLSYEIPRGISKNSNSISSHGSTSSQATTVALTDIPAGPGRPKQDEKITVMNILNSNKTDQQKRDALKFHVEKINNDKILKIIFDSGLYLPGQKSKASIKLNNRFSNTQTNVK